MFLLLINLLYSLLNSIKMPTQFNSIRNKKFKSKAVATLQYILFFGLLVNTLNAKITDSIGDVMLHPSVKNLEKIKGLTESTIFDLTVNGQNAFVYHSREIMDQYEHIKQLKSISYQGVSYVNFSMSKKVKLQINSLNGKASNWKILPKRADVKVDETTNSIIFTLNKPEKFVISAVIGGLEQSIIISAEKPETNIPSKTDKGVLYLGPGIHQYGQAWDPFVNGIHTVYVAGGAILEATIKSNKKNNVKILGRGILSQSFVTHAEESSPNEKAREQEWDADWLGVVFTDSQNIEIDGITIMNSPSYQLEVANCKSVKINNVKLCGFGEHNNDGIHTYGNNVLVEDSFIASNDDRVCITGLFDKENGTDNLQWDGSNELTGVSVSNITLRNMVFWGLDNNGADIMLTWNGSGNAKNILVENAVSLTGTNKAFIAARHGGSADIHDLIFRNIILYHPNLFDVEIGESNYQGAGGGKLRNLLLENFTIHANFRDIGKQLKGESKASNIEGIIFKNIITNDGVLTDLNQIKLISNEFVTNLNTVK
jgi:Glycosyl hydrolases family 28